MDLGELNGRMVTDPSGSGQVPMVGSCDHGNEYSDFIKGG